ncbi:MAG TPA: ATP-binding protein, partial [Lysobacter sp.]
LEDGRELASQNGTLGGACPSVREQRVDAPRRSLVVMHSDGLSSRWSIRTHPGLRSRHPQVIAAALFRDAWRVRDDATVLVVETGEAA